MAGPYKHYERLKYEREQKETVNKHYTKGGPFNVLYRAALACTGRTPLAVIRAKEAKKKAKLAERTKNGGGRN